MAGGGNGELSRGGAARGQAGPLPAAAARVLRAGAEVRAPGQVVRLHRQGQPAQRLAHALRSQHIPGTGTQPPPNRIVVYFLSTANVLGSAVTSHRRLK